MKQKILKLLSRAEKGMMSGVAMSSRLGISRVAVWKQIKGLKEEGYEISSSSKGYRLENHDDLLLPEFFPGMEERIHYFPTLGSTMDKARKLARTGLTEMEVVVSETQTRGRGRLDRSWVSGQGGLWITLMLRPPLPPPLAFRINFAASLSLAQCLNQLFAMEARVKWPNDILVGDLKLAGLLSEMETRGDMLSHVLVGIGLNVNNDTEEIRPKAVSLKKILGRRVSRRDILANLIREMESRLPDLAQNDIIPEWKKLTSTIGRRVRVETHRDLIEGRAEDVDSDGALMVRTHDGELQRIIYGDCFY